ncbi:MAG: hypothetical protein ACJ782_19965 [Actinomycetota bacterium]
MPARRLAHRPGQAEVDQHRPAVAQDHVARLDVQAGQAAVVQVAEGGGRLHADEQHVDGVERPLVGQGVVDSAAAAEGVPAVEGVEGGVDSRGSPVPRSATLPHRDRGSSLRR